jgi:hypothetical protein
MEYQNLELHTSDRILFKRCRRKWDWQSPLRDSLVPIGEVNPHLWFGTGLHFALEDWHGLKKYSPKNPMQAFDTFVDCFRIEERPENWNELQYIGNEVLQYYHNYWHDLYFKQYRTATLYDIAKLNGNYLPPDLANLYSDKKMNHPLVEIEFEVDLPRNYTYRGTLDRIVIDPYDRLWIVDYKSASRMDTLKLETDPQMSAYAWGAYRYFGIKFEGVILMQFVKDVPEKPRLLKNGTFSQSKTQKTTYKLYTEALQEEYHGIPDMYVDFVNYLAAKEIENGDSFIRYDMIRKNEYQIAYEEVKILYELSDMTNSDLFIYPNPTKDCSWDCPFRSACIAKDDGSDFEFILNNEFIYLPGGRDYAWRANLPE